MTEDKIKEAFEATYGKRNEWRNWSDYDVCLGDFRAGYMACLNGLELEYVKRAERTIDAPVLLYRLPEGVTKP